MNYIKQFVTDIINGSPRLHPAPHQEPFRTLAFELNRLDPRDFEPSVQSQFLHLKTTIEYCAKSGGFSPSVMTNLFQALKQVLDEFRGMGSGNSPRAFPYIQDADLRRIIDRDYAELTIRLFPAGAWKSTVIMAGSILESMLFDVLSNPKRVAATNSSAKAAKGKGGVPIDISANPDKWKLINLIDVAVDTGVLPVKRADTIDQVMRDYRNFVHPHVEKAAQHECSEPEAGLAKYGLDGVCDHFEKTI